MARVPDLFVPKAPSLVSSRRPALRFLASGPWHLKHLSERIGRTWKLKSTFRAGSAARAAMGRASHSPAAKARHASPVATLAVDSVWDLGRTMIAPRVARLVSMRVFSIDYNESRPCSQAEGPGPEET